jgi:hypothetical protein
LSDTEGNFKKEKLPMAIQIYLEPVREQSRFVPLAVVGYCLTRSGLLKPLWSELKLTMKQYDHSAVDKLQDVLVAIMAGCRSLSQVETRLRPERALAEAWQRKRFAEQSNLSRTLDRMHAEQIEQLRVGHGKLLRQHSQLHHHDWSTPVMLDIDPTSLLASKHAEGSRKGWVSGQRNRYCRHVIRFMVAGYHETLLSVAYPGNRHGYEYCKPALNHLLRDWHWSPAQRRQIIVRSDAEQGTDANIAYLLWLGFQVLMKAYSGRRTQAWVKRTDESLWQPDPTGQTRWAASAPSPLRLGRHLDAYLLRWLDSKEALRHATLLTTLPHTPFTQWALYDGRGACEIEIRSDKSGLQLTRRRKHPLDAQEAWILLTDVAHNLLAWLQPWMLADSPFAAFGPQRLVSDLLTIPGQLFFEHGRLTKVALWETHPYAEEMMLCLQKLLKTFDLH